MAMLSHPEAPAAASALSRGMHVHPQDGACLMEYVSLVAGVPFSDTPACTDRLVAMVAILANDNVEGARRGGLVAYASALESCPPRTAEQRAATLVAVLEVAMRFSGDAGLARRRRHAERRRAHLAGRPEGTGLAARTRARLWLSGPARQSLEYAVAVVAKLPADRRDATLLAMLEAAITPDRETRATTSRTGHATADRVAGLAS
ncbi:hypothetical protein [Yinghuangia seranimata]|uniref:hypothetical protein n=1 Tax=Yinghuangia seranimata TaxID=408067 RepID=UPI00248CEAC0|nr:hypothetical protein [Yinghuangia seranimata]MDI2124996.1 hypothetical protein [Yinghuangia seranimata]